MVWCQALGVRRRALGVGEGVRLLMNIAHGKRPIGLGRRGDGWAC